MSDLLHNQPQYRINAWTIIKTYKTTNINALETEVGVISLDLYLNQAILQSKNNFRCGKEIKQAKMKIQKKLQDKKEENASQRPFL